MADDCAERITRLAKQYGDMVFATAYRILGDSDDAEDAFQEVFLKLITLWKRRPNPEVVGDWGAYLRVVATRSAIDLRRRRSRRWKNRVAVTAAIQDTTAERADDLAAQHQRANALRQAMGRLTKRDALVFALRCFEDFSYEEIAAQTGLTVNQVGVILHRGRKTLQEALDRRGAADAGRCGMGSAAGSNPDSGD
jgi:RNA polymerase sigma-70 factor (ECF subfamily)